MTAYHVVKGPQWVMAVSMSASKAHLVADTGATNHSSEAQTWCGAVADLTKPMPYQTRCKDCLRRLTKYVNEATVAPPELVTESVTVVVTRPAGGNRMSLSEVVSRSVARHQDWKVEHYNGEVQ